MKYLDSSSRGPVARTTTPRPLLVSGGAALGLLSLLAAAAPGQTSKGVQTVYANDNGSGGLYNTAGKIDIKNPFFGNLGANGRLCFTCHDPAQGASLSPKGIQQKFTTTQGTDPLFRTNDGSISPNADVSTLAARQQAYRLLTGRGVFRIGLPVPAGAEFKLEFVEDPYNYASASELSLYRRPLPASNLPFLATVMWDGRQTHDGFSLTQNLAAQASDATTGHAQASSAPDAATLSKIVAFEMGLFNAQVKDAVAGPLTVSGIKAGPTPLAKQEFYEGINDPFGADPHGKPFNPVVFQLFQKWNKPAKKNDNQKLAAQKAIARGEVLFNTKQFHITGVPGLNDVHNQPHVIGTCSTCHNTPNVGGHSSNEFMNIGVGTVNPTILTDLPRYTLRNLNTLDVQVTTDPGRALVTGKWDDVGKFKVPGLRGLGARAPYFHDGSAGLPIDVVRFYNSRFNIGFTQQEMQDLAAFLRAL